MKLISFPSQHSRTVVHQYFIFLWRWGGTDKDIRAPGSGCLFTLEKSGVCWLAVWWLKVWQHMTAGYFYIKYNQFW